MAEVKPGTERASTSRPSQLEIALENQTTARPRGLLGGEAAHCYAAKALGETHGETEVELAVRVGVVRGNRLERTATEHEGNLTISFAAG